MSSIQASPGLSVESPEPDRGRGQSVEGAESVDDGDHSATEPSCAQPSTLVPQPLPGPQLSTLDPQPSPDEPALRVMALHALAYCERLFYLEEVEEIRVADERVYAGRELHAGIEAAEGEEKTSFELESRTLGLKGKIDCLRRRDGSIVPYEHKRGRPRRDEEGKKGGGKGTPAAWPSDHLQVVSYAMLLEEATGAPISEARIHYHAENVTVRVPVDEAARAEVHAALNRARELRRLLERPPITDNERLCVHCSLAPVCLPEEVRQAKKGSGPIGRNGPEGAAHQLDLTPFSPQRLFPPDRDGTSLHVVSHGAHVGRSGDSIVIKPREGPETKHPARQIDSVLLHGYSQISTQAMRMCVEHGIGVHWLSMTGFHTASLVPTAGQVQRRIRQYRALTDESLCLRLTRSLVLAKVEGQVRYLLRASRGNRAARSTMLRDLAAMRDLLRPIRQATERDSLRGYEGTASVHYFQALRAVISDGVPEELRYVTRNRRPPLDRFNALLSFGYGLVHSAVMRAVLATGLEPALGFFHTPRSAAYPLVLDLMELFRVPLWDLVVVGSLNRAQWNPDRDFTVTRTKAWLSDEGRKQAIQLFENRLEETWKHPVLQYSLSYARTIELEARLLEKEWTGEPGLFARMRLR